MNHGFAVEEIGPDEVEEIKQSAFIAGFQAGVEQETKLREQAEARLERVIELTKESIYATKLFKDGRNNQEFGDRCFETFMNQIAAVTIPEKGDK